MFKSLKRTAYQVPDMAKGRQWYRSVLGTDPVFDAPFAVVFLIGDFELVLTPSAGQRVPGYPGAIAYWGVDDVDAAYTRLKALGATHHSEINTFNGTRVATVIDPFGNILGIRGTEADKSRASVEHRPSESAQMVAALRALAALEERESIRCRDHLAEIFLTQERRAALQNSAISEWMKKNPPGVYEYAIARTAFFDDVVERALRNDVPQIVFLGAGYDSRPYRFRDLIRNTRIFEVDAPSTQKRKREQLMKANVSVPEQVMYVPINFKTDDLTGALSALGFDKTKTALFVWEGVTFYLTPALVDATLHFIRFNSGAGSSVCFDCSTSSPDRLSRYGVKELGEAMRASFPGEATLFNIEEGKVAGFLAARGFSVLDLLTPDEMERKFLVLPDGSTAGRVTAMFNLVHARVSREDAVPETLDN